MLQNYALLCNISFFVGQLTTIDVTPDDQKMKQDKVNYAVSEREDMSSDLTMLTRMTGCNGM